MTFATGNQVLVSGEQSETGIFNFCDELCARQFRSVRCGKNASQKSAARKEVKPLECLGRKNVFVSASAIAIITNSDTPPGQLLKEPAKSRSIAVEERFAGCHGD